jgi:dihydroorotate dehydrogenase (NAD+) catalytic subunit
LPDLPIIGLGGVRSAEDARQYLAVGATLVGIGTGGLADPRLPGRIIRELERHGG